MKLTIKKPTQLSPRRPNFFCKGYLPLVESSVMMLYSGGGVGKSFASIRVAMNFAAETGKKAILWLTEDPEGENRYRYERLLSDFANRDREFFDSRLAFVDDPPAKLTKLRDGNAVLTDEFWSIRLAFLEYDLVILDPLLQFQGGDENSNTHAGVFMGAMKQWASEERKSLLLLHHASRNAHTGRLKPRGAGEWVNGTRGAYEIQAITQETSEGTVMCQQNRDRRRFVLVKDNGVSFHFRDPKTQQTEKILPVFPPMSGQDEEEELKPGFVRISKADHNSEKIPTGFEQITVPFDALHFHVTEECCYSPYLFADGHRKNENNLGVADVLCLDFDGDMPLLKAEMIFKDVKSLIVTTRSHQKTGKGDRFRVFIKFKTPLNIVPEDHNDLMMAMFDEYGSVDPSVKDMARFFFASPKDATYSYSKAEKELDWEPFFHAVKKKKLTEKIRKMRKPKGTFKPSGRTPDNTLPKDTQFFTKRGDCVTFESLRDTLSEGAKEVVRCRHDIDHGDVPQIVNASAFIGKADNGNVFYHCSGGRCASDRAQWCAE